MANLVRARNRQPFNFQDGLLVSGAPIVGATGPAGPAGPVGPQGPAGTNGPAGPAGPAGANGTTGQTGPAGPQGPAGAAGVAGAKGDKGDKGDQGIQGPAGSATTGGAVNGTGQGQVPLTGYVVMSTTAPPLFSYAGDIIATGNVSGFSDESLKTNWKTLGRDFVLKLSNVKAGTYERIDQENKSQAGASAQSLQLVLPEAVTTGSNGLLAINYGNAALVSAIELAKEVIILQCDVLSMRDRISTLEAAIIALTNKG